MHSFRLKLRKTFGKIHKLPTLPPVVVTLENALRNENASADDIARIISNDISISSNILRLVNSAYYSPGTGSITSISEAVVRLGLHEIKHMCTTLAVISAFNKIGKFRNHVQFWKHCIAVANAARPIMRSPSSIVTITYFGGEKAVPGYNVMGICKAALEASVRYLAFDLGPAGIRVNALSAGPVRTLAGRAAGVDNMLNLYQQMAPLGRNITHEEVGRTGAFLLSDLSNGITAEIMHVDSGYNAMGSPGRLLDRYHPSPP